MYSNYRVQVFMLAPSTASPTTVERTMVLVPADAAAPLGTPEAFTLPLVPVPAVDPNPCTYVTVMSSGAVHVPQSTGPAPFLAQNDCTDVRGRSLLAPRNSLVHRAA